MASRRARLARTQTRTAERTAAVQRVGEARTEIEHRSLLAAATPLRDELPDFYATALLTGVVPDPAPVPEQMWAAPTSLVPVVQPGSYLGLTDGLRPDLTDENGAHDVDLSLNTGVQWQQVKCQRCGREYQCTPWDDFYETPDGDSCCETCLTGGRPLLYLIEQEDGTVAGPFGPLAPLPTGPEASA